MRTQALAVVPLIAITLFAAGQVASHAPTIRESSGSISDRPVVRVNGVNLTQGDLLREMYTIFPYARQHNGTFPKSMEPEIRKGAMQMIVFEELVYQEAIRRKMSVAAPEMAKAERDFQKQFSSAAEFQQVLSRDFHGSKTLLRSKIRRSLLIDQLLKIEIDRKATVSLAEARAVYDKHPERFEIPEGFEFQSISVLPPEHPNRAQQDEADKKAADFLKRAKTTSTYQEFGLLAEKVSEDDYRVNMGDHKTVPRAELPPEVAKTLLAMKPGQVSDLVKLGDAYTIVRLNKHVMARKKPFAEAKQQIVQQIRAQKLEGLRAALDRKLRKNAKVEEL